MGERQAPAWLPDSTCPVALWRSSFLLASSMRYDTKAAHATTIYLAMDCSVPAASFPPCRTPGSSEFQPYIFFHAPLRAGCIVSPAVSNLFKPSPRVFAVENVLTMASTAEIDSLMEFA